MGKGIKRQKNGQKLDRCFIFSAADMASIVNSHLALTAVHQFQKCWMEVDRQSMCHMCRRHATSTQAQVRLHWTAWRSDLSSVNYRKSCLSCCWSKGVEWPAKRCYVSLVAVGVQERHTCSAAATKLFDFNNIFLFLVIISPPEQWSLQ